MKIFTSGLQSCEKKVTVVPVTWASISTWGVLTSHKAKNLPQPILHLTSTTCPLLNSLSFCSHTLSPLFLLVSHSDFPGHPTNNNQKLYSNTVQLPSSWEPLVSVPQITTILLQNSFHRPHSLQDISTKINFNLRGHPFPLSKRYCYPRLTLHSQHSCKRKYLSESQKHDTLYLQFSYRMPLCLSILFNATKNTSMCTQLQCRELCSSAITK